VKLKEIERLRAFAALLVLCVHWPPLQKFLPAMLADPWSGVDLFFVISGFVVTLSLVRLLPPLEGEHSFVDGFSRARPGLKTFYVRRFFRIMPAALAVALLVRLMTGVLPAEFGTSRLLKSTRRGSTSAAWNLPCGSRCEARTRSSRRCWC
jgi:peptidoglycan/LPS O-acetylase OafA/YrhL